MNVKKFRAATAREALKLVKAELGEDAIVLANRSVPGGVEIIAMPASEIASSPPPAASVKQSSAPKPKTIRPFEPPRIVTADYAARQEDVAAAGEAARVKAGLEALQKRVGRDAGRSVAERDVARTECAARA
jgi:flagellar biosynthesis protein FlhF